MICLEPTSDEDENEEEMELPEPEHKVLSEPAPEKSIDAAVQWERRDNIVDTSVHAAYKAQMHSGI